MSVTLENWALGDRAETGHLAESGPTCNGQGRAIEVLEPETVMAEWIGWAFESPPLRRPDQREDMVLYFAALPTMSSAMSMIMSSWPPTSLRAPTSIRMSRASMP